MAELRPLTWRVESATLLACFPRLIFLVFALSPIVLTAQTKGPLPVNPADAKNQVTGQRAPAADPSLARYGIYAESTPYPVKGRRS